DQMAEKLDPHPSLDDALDILSKTPKDRLLSLKYKLDHPKSKIETLVYGMVLVSLNKTEEAQVELKKLKNDPEAQYISNRIHLVGQKPQSPKDTDFLTTLARVFRLLVVENLCEPAFRDKAYKAAIEAYKSGEKTGNLKLHDLVEEYKNECGLQNCSIAWISEHLQLLKPYQDGFTSSEDTLVRTPAVPIQKGKSPRSASGMPHSLQSSQGNQLSFPSHLQISHSPTMCLVSERQIKDPITVPCQNAGLDSLVFPLSLNHNDQDKVAQNEDMLSTNIQDHGAPSLHSSSTALEHPPTFSPGGAQVKDNSHDLSCNRNPSLCQENEGTAVKCTDSSTRRWCFAAQVEVSKPMDKKPIKEQGAQQILTPEYTTGVTNSTKVPEEDTYPKTEQSKSDHLSSQLPSELSETELLSSEKKFYTFVILHLPEDVTIASRVQDTLERHGIADGATSSDFLIPGQSPLACIQNIVDNSAFTILLLTSKFASKWAEYQTNMVLMNSIHNLHKYNSVIPFFPKEDSLSITVLPLALRCLTGLKENIEERVFQKILKTTFSRKKIQQQKSLWEKEQRMKELQEKTLQLNEEVHFHREYSEKVMLYNQQLCQLNFYQYLTAAHCLPLNHSQVPPGIPSEIPLHIPSNMQNFLRDQHQVFSPAGPHGSQSGNQAIPDSQPTQCQPIIHIEKATNVQIGNQNQMRFESSANEESEDTEEE
uniref:TIR domain containing adaptor molecule 1 n=1 Tax=Latimeria chalumnae TaxID=7897 RepID=H3BDQ0_LATCH